MGLTPLQWWQLPRREQTLSLAYDKRLQKDIDQIMDTLAEQGTLDPAAFAVLTVAKLNG